MFPGSPSLCATSTLLYLSDTEKADGRLLHFLRQEGFRLQVVQTAQEVANRLLSANDADAVLIRHDHIETGSMMACSFKFICPQTPIILLSTRHPSTEELPVGVDALFFGNLQNDDAVPHIACAVRQLVAGATPPGEACAAAANAYMN